MVECLEHPGVDKDDTLDAERRSALSPLTLEWFVTWFTRSVFCLKHRSMSDNPDMPVNERTSVLLVEHHGHGVAFGALPSYNGRHPCMS